MQQDAGAGRAPFRCCLELISASVSPLVTAGSLRQGERETDMEIFLPYLNFKQASWGLTDLQGGFFHDSFVPFQARRPDL